MIRTSIACLALSLASFTTSSEAANGVWDLEVFTSPSSKTKKLSYTTANANVGVGATGTEARGLVAGHSAWTSVDIQLGVVGFQMTKRTYKPHPEDNNEIGDIEAAFGELVARGSARTIRGEVGVRVMGRQELDFWIDSKLVKDKMAMIDISIESTKGVFWNRVGWIDFWTSEGWIRGWI